MDKSHRYVRQLLSAGVLTLSMSICLQGSAAVGDSDGVARYYYNGDSPSPFPFYDFAYYQHKAECVSGGVVTVVSDHGVGQSSIYCQSPLSNLAPIRFTQSMTNTPYLSEDTEDFSSHDSAHYGSHGAGDWDKGFLKGECPSGMALVGLAATIDGSNQTTTLHCASTAAMCSSGGQMYSPTNNCYASGVSGPFNDAFCVNSGDLMVGVSVDLNHHPKKILCCNGVWSNC